MKTSMISLWFGLVAIGQAIAGSPDPVELKKIENRGREIATYEQVSIRSTDLLLALKPDHSKLGAWVAVATKEKWWVFYGRLAKDGEPDGFIIAYTFSAPITDVTDTRLVGPEEEQPAISTTEIYQLAKAVSLAKKEPSPWNLPWNPSVFRETDGAITVYLLPGFQKVEDTSIGGDFRLVISPDATKIVKKDPLHKSLIPAFPKGLPPGAKATGTFHSHVLTDLPTETDVAFAILHPEFEMHGVMSQKYRCLVNKTGKISEMK